MSKPFALQLFDRYGNGDKRDRFQVIDFDVATNDASRRFDPVLATLPKREIDYGHLFTYCFRRFGFPNVGSDGYKEIARWVLTTPDKRLLLNISPSVLPDPYFSIRFMAEQELSFACRNWDRIDIDAWMERSFNWVEAQGLPAWMPDLVEQYRKEMRHPEATWRDAYLGYIIFFERKRQPSGDPERDERDSLLEEFAARVQSYAEVEQRPKFRKRSRDIGSWSDDDPMKPLAFAAIEALKDLSTGVRVRDSAINAFGRSEDDYGRVVAEPEVAGYGLGNLLNPAPKEAGELYRTVLKLGSGDVKEGIKKLLQLQEKAQQGSC